MAAAGLVVSSHFPAIHGSGLFFTCVRVMELVSFSHRGRLSMELDLSHPH